MAEDMGNSVESEPEDTLPFLPCGQLRLRLHLATPSITEHEGHGEHPEALFDLPGVRHGRRFQVEAAFLEVAENLLNSPSPPVKPERLLSMKAVARQIEKFVPSLLSLDGAS